MTGQMEWLENVGDHAGIITAVSAALIVLWRYVLKPSVKVVSAWKRHSEGIAYILPLLESGRARWSASSGSGSFLHFIDTLERSCIHNKLRLDAILDLIHNPIYECSVDGMCIFANEKLCELFGLSHEDMLGVGWIGGIIPEERERVHSAWTNAVAKGIPYECTYITRNARTGRLHSATARALPLHSQWGVIGYVGFFTSIEPLGEPPAHISDDDQGSQAIDTHSVA